MQTLRKLVVIGVALTVSATVSGCVPVVNSQSVPRPAAVAAPKPAAQAPARPAEGAATRVGLLLPLSGPQAPLGQSLLEASQLALYEVGSNDFSLMPQDTGGTPARAAEAAQTALNDGATLLIGPVFSPELEAVRQVAAPRHVPVLSLSNNTMLADSNNFILGFSPGDQVERIVKYAQSRGIKRVAALVPHSPYGDAVADALSGFEGVTLERYAPEANTNVVAQNLVANLNAGGVEALLLPDKSLAAPLVAAGLDVNRIHLLGTALWDGAQPSPALVGAWYTGFDPAQRKAFVARYSQTYGHPPVAIASLAYDATAMAAVLSKNGGEYTAGRLTDAQGFSGVDGVFRLTPTGQVERGLAVFAITPTGVQVLEAAPKGF